MLPRWKHKSWQNKRYSWDRRITWYQGPNDIRLKVEHESGKYNLFFTDSVDAQKAFDSFKEGVNPKGVLDR